MNFWTCSDLRILQSFHFLSHPEQAELEPVAVGTEPNRTVGFLQSGETHTTHVSRNTRGSQEIPARLGAPRDVGHPLGARDPRSSASETRGPWRVVPRMPWRVLDGCWDVSRTYLSSLGSRKQLQLHEFKSLENPGKITENPQKLLGNSPENHRKSLKILRYPRDLEPRETRNTKS